MSGVGADVPFHCGITVAVCCNTTATALSDTACFIITHNGHRKNTSKNRMSGISNK